MRLCFLALLLASCATKPPTQAGSFEIIAHRGVYQTFPAEGLKNDTCTATRIHPPRHAFLENTIASMREAFRLGATIVEFDIHATSDGQMVVFHDWTLDCRTNGKGVTHEQLLAYLKSLDIGYGYTADGGKTYPFRGKGVGLMPSLQEVLQTFPDRKFLINQKDRRPETTTVLAGILKSLPKEQRERLFYWGLPEPFAKLHELIPEVRTLFVDVAEAKRCAYRYFGYGWTGVVPDACEHIGFAIPTQHTGKFWGWPWRFIDRMHEHDSRVYVREVNSMSAVEALKGLPIDGVLTDRIDELGPALQALNSAR